MKLSIIIIVILLQLASLQGYSQTDVWPGPDSSICMTKKKAAELANMMDSLSNLYTLNELLEETIRNSDIVIKSSEEALSNLFNQKIVLENKILNLEEQLDIRSDKESLLKEEVEQCSIVLLKANKQIKRQKTTMTITGTVAGISLIGIIISILVIAI